MLIMNDAAQSLVSKASPQTDDPRAVFAHFYGHCINLAASDSMKTNRIVKMPLKQLMKLPDVIFTEAQRKVEAN